MRIPRLLRWVEAEPGGPEWLAALPQVLATCAAHWKLELGAPFEASQVSYAAAAIRDSGERVVLKVQFPDREAEHEADALRVYAGRGHVRLLEHAPDLHALLLERCDPGTSIGQESESVVKAASFELLRRTWPASDAFLRLEDELPLWLAELQEGKSAGGSAPVPAESVSVAAQVLRGLAATQGAPTLVNRDLHQDNVLASTREPWLVIDPKPIVAEPEFSLANRLPMFGATPIERAGADVIDRLNRHATALGLDPHRARAWAFVRSVSWSLYDRALGAHFARVAGTLLQSIHPGAWSRSDGPEPGNESHATSAPRGRSRRVTSKDERGPHDGFVKQTFQSPEHATSLLRSALPAALSQRIDWDSLELVPTEQLGDWFDKRFGDLLFRARLRGEERNVYIDVLLEHQSESQHFMVLRILSMLTRRYEQLLRNEPTLKRLPIVLPVVLFQGDADGRNWRHPTRLRDILDADTETLAAFAPFIPDFEFRVDDLTRQSLDELHARALTSLAYVTLRLLRDARTNPRLLEELQAPREMATWLHIANGPGGLLDLARLLRYLYRTVDARENIRAFAHQLGSIGEKADMTAADRLIAEVTPQIQAKARTEGAALLLRRLIALKFGGLDAQSDARVSAASFDELERWSERILSAESLRDVFAE